jgi:hypothetical protein
MSKTLFPIPQDLLNKLRRANSEATVRQLVIQQLDCEDIKLEEDKSDASHENILIEFKLNEDMQHKEGNRAKILAEALYYCRNFYIDGKRVPPYIALIDKDEFVFYRRETLEPIYKDLQLFQTGIPSDPTESVIEKCKHIEPFRYIFVDSQQTLDSAINQLRQIVHSQTVLADDITEYNIASLYSSWSNLFTQFLNHTGNENKPHVFRQDCCEDGEIIKIESDLLGNEVITIEFKLDREIALIERCPKSEYSDFWSRWNRIKNRKEEKQIFQKAADLFKMDVRRKKGQFYTPTNLAKHGWAYLEKELGKDFWFDGTWRIWDCSCGEGGLAINVIPRSALQYTYLSSLDAGEVDFIRHHLPMCKKIWKMDFLNTLLQNFPDEIKRDMENPDIKWLFFINPPYGENCSGKATSNSEWRKTGVANSLVKFDMNFHNMTLASKEKYAQFLFRIEKEFKGRYVLGSYTKIKVFVSKEYANLRKFWRPVFKGGLICCANKWHQGSGAFPIAFSVFDGREKGKWGELVYDILEYRKGNVYGIFKGKKSFSQEDIKRSFRQYFFPSEGLPNDELTVVQSNGLKTFDGTSETSNYRPKGTLASAFYNTDYMRTQQYSRMVSGVTIHHNVFINRKNYQRTLSGLGLYWSVNHTWTNDADCFYAPKRNLTPQEQSDAILYALMNERNRTTTARLDYAPQGITVGKKKNVANGGIVENKLNPFNKKLFDWSDCSDTGKKVLQLYKHYLDNVVKWKEQETVIGKGEWLGLYQYHRIVPLPKELVAAIEVLRTSVEKTALELCF